MKEKKIPVTYVLYPDEARISTTGESTFIFSVSEQFLSSCLGGRSQGYGEDLNGSSITVPEGVEHIKGLQEGLKAKK